MFTEKQEVKQHDRNGSPPLARSHAMLVVSALAQQTTPLGVWLALSSLEDQSRRAEGRSSTGPSWAHRMFNALARLLTRTKSPSMLEDVVVSESTITNVASLRQATDEMDLSAPKRRRA